MKQNHKQKIKDATIPQKYLTKRIIGISCLVLAFLLMLVNHYLIDSDYLMHILKFAKVLLFAIGWLLLIPFEWIPYVFFDNREYDKNVNLDQLVEKVRFRAVLFNNISILVFVFTLSVIILCFFLLINPNIKGNDWQDITVRISASVLLIFLVQMLFKLFKYLLRVAAFYNGKADAIEYSKIESVPLEKTIDYFTPGNYDITDMEGTISSSLIDALKSKLGT